MLGQLAFNGWIWLSGALILFAALRAAEAVMAPVAFALLLIALLWPLQRRLQAVVPRFLALPVTILVLVVGFAAFASLVAWGFGRVGRWGFANMARFQTLYERATGWLE